MHEMSLCEGLLKALEDNAAREGFRRVKAVWLEVGDLSGVEPDALRFNFSLAARGTLAEGAVLNIMQMPRMAGCEDCACSTPLSHCLDACPVCGRPLHATDGGAMRIRELEVE